MDDYPQRLHQGTPSWVASGSLFHIRIRTAHTQTPALISSEIAPALLHSAQQYHASGTWWCDLFLLMPDQLHALLKFPRNPGMSEVIRRWKRGVARIQEVDWQDNYFDHRIRSHAEALTKWYYIRRNPVVKGLCAKAEDWPHWWSATGGCGL